MAKHSKPEAKIACSDLEGKILEALNTLLDLSCFFYDPANFVAAVWLYMMSPDLAIDEVETALKALGDKELFNPDDYVYSVVQGRHAELAGVGV